MKKNRHYELMFPKVIPRMSNCTELFILPALGWNLSNMKLVLDKKTYSSEDLLKLMGYKSCYLEAIDAPDKFDREIYIIFQPNKYCISTHFPKFFSYLKEMSTFLSIYCVDIQTFVVVLQIDDKWKDLNVKRIVKAGKYSLLGLKYAGHYFGYNETPYQVIMKTPERKLKLEQELGIELDNKYELFSKPDLEKETLIWNFPNT